MAFSDTIETTFLTTVYLTRGIQSQDGAGNYDSSIETIAHGLRGDVQPASRWSYRPTGQGADYRITHAGFFDVPESVPAEGDILHDGTTEYAVGNVRDFRDHLELELGGGCKSDVGADHGRGGHRHPIRPGCLRAARRGRRGRPRPLVRARARGGMPTHRLQGGAPGPAAGLERRHRQPQGLHSIPDGRLRRRGPFPGSGRLGRGLQRRALSEWPSAGEHAVVFAPPAYAAHVEAKSSRSVLLEPVATLRSALLHEAADAARREWAAFGMRRTSRGGRVV